MTTPETTEKFSIKLEIPKRTYELHNAVKLKSIFDIKPTSRLFYEVCFYSDIKHKNWHRSGIFQEIIDVIEYIAREPRLHDKNFIEHHNFVIIESEEFMSEELEERYLLALKNASKEKLELFEQVSSLMAENRKLQNCLYNLSKTSNNNTINNKSKIIK